ncbi:MAG: hypothetical protein KGQ79_00840 [Proteobacteria bacterium]|nr:hypothetical protein [Pseudomonadota bacterium]
MLPAPDYGYINKILNEEHFLVGNNPAQGIPTGRNVIGFIFFDQNLRREPVSDFLDNINLLNQYSGKQIHFFLPGVSLFGPNEGDHAVLIGEVDGINAYHNSRAFMSFKDEFEQKIPQWKYNFGVDIVLVDVIGAKGNRTLDFSSAIFFKVEEFIQLKIVDRTTELLGKIIKFHREAKLATAKDAKLLLQQQFGIDWFKSLIFVLFPKSIQKLARAQAVLGGGAALR